LYLVFPGFRPTMWYLQIERTYNVPANWVLRKAWSSGKNLASPKSPILGWNLSSRRMLLALMSRWTILKCESSWRYCNPRATPRIIWNLVLQFRNWSLFPDHTNIQTVQLFQILMTHWICYTHTTCTGSRKVLLPITMRDFILHIINIPCWQLI